MHVYHVVHNQEYIKGMLYTFLNILLFHQVRTKVNCLDWFLVFWFAISNISKCDACIWYKNGNGQMVIGHLWRMYWRPTTGKLNMSKIYAMFMLWDTFYQTKIRLKGGGAFFSSKHSHTSFLIETFKYFLSHLIISISHVSCLI